jgi:CBS-domain-containing membrane protein
MRAPVPAPPRLSLWADTAADLMSDNPVSLQRDATIREALGLMLDRGVTAAPVIDVGGRAIGVVSVTDVLVHERVRAGAPVEAAPPGGRFEVEPADPATVEDIMTPDVFTVRAEYPADQVVADLLRLNVHRLFVEDGQGVIVGVVTATDVLRRMAK